MVILNAVGIELNGFEYDSSFLRKQLALLELHLSLSNVPGEVVEANTVITLNQATTVESTVLTIKFWRHPSSRTRLWIVQRFSSLLRS